MRTKILYILIVLFSLVSFVANAQKERDLIKEGNKLYDDKKYEEANIKYRKALEKNNSSNTALFNLGDALYKKGEYEEAAAKFAELTTKDLDAETLSASYHNLANSLLQSKKYEESIEAYKQSLKLNPKDDESRYNLEYAKKMLKKQQQQQQQQQNNQNKDNKDNNQQQQQQQQQNDKNKDNKDNKDKGEQQDKSDKDNKDKQKDNSEGDEKDNKDKSDNEEINKKENKISEKDAERILQALSNEEKNVQKKVKKMKSSNVKIEKNW